VADELGITVAELVASFAPRHKDLSGPEMDVAFAEVIGVVSAETFKEPSDDAVRLDVIDYVYKRKPGRRTYALRISGSCMEPKASDGDYAVIEETSDVPDGALAVICWDGECTLKRVYHRSDHLELRPDNPEYKILRPKLKDCQIIGIVKSFHRKP
jgi:SOS-response transcriptional repressor LexA